MKRWNFLCLAMFTLFGLTGSYANADLTAYWSFDSDFTATHGGSNFDLTAVGGATAGSTAGKFGNAASFSRAASQYAFTGGDVLTANSDFSYSAWYNLSVSDITGSDRYFVLETTAGDTPSGTQAWTASIGARDIGGSDDVQIFTSPSNGFGNTPLIANTWQNVIVTYDSNAGEIRAYLDGTLFATDTQNSTTAVGGLVIGGHRAGTGRNWEGSIDAVSFYDHVLTEEEISQLQTTAAIPEPSSVAIVGIAGLALGFRRRKRS